MEHNRLAEKIISDKLQANKVVVLLGSRRVGKTQLINKIIKDSTEKILF
ncbi:MULTISPECIES: hypothetical protein [unclassified Chryseobacterium]|nr:MULTISPECIES: hypothetical protein [unclassified Chryseobacterium]